MNRCCYVGITSSSDAALPSSAEQEKKKRALAVSRSRLPHLVERRLGQAWLIPPDLHDLPGWRRRGLGRSGRWNRWTEATPCGEKHRCQGGCGGGDQDPDHGVLESATVAPERSTL